MVGQGIALTKVAKLRQFPTETSLILNGDTIGPLGARRRPGGRGPISPRGHYRGPRAWILKCGGASVVVNKVLHTVLCQPHLPAIRQGHLTLGFALCPRVFPLGGSIFVIDKIDSSVGFNPFLPAIGQRPQAVVLCGATTSRVGIEKPLVFNLQDLNTNSYN